MMINALFAAVFAMTNVNGSVTYYFGNSNSVSSALRYTSTRLIRNTTKLPKKKTPEYDYTITPSVDDYSQSDNQQPIILNVQPPDVYVENYYNDDGDNWQNFEPPRETALDRLNQRRHERFIQIRHEQEERKRCRKR